MKASKTVKLFGLLLAASPAMIFAQTQQQAKPFSIKADIDGLNAPMVYMYSRSGDQLVLDSAKVNKGVFSFNGSNKNGSVAVIFLKYFKDRITFYNDGGTIKISGEDGKLATAKVEGVPTESASELFDKTFKANSAVLKDTVLYNEYKTAMATNDTVTVAKIMKKVQAVNGKLQAQQDLFIYAFPSDEKSLNFLRGKLSSGDYTALNETFNSLDASLKTSKQGESIAKQLEIMKTVAVGQPAVAFTQNDINDKPISLSDFKGKYVLVDFWASWCGPCRAENPNVVKAYNQYKGKNFTILGVSLDNKKENWEKAIKDDHLDWTQVSDLKGWQNEVAAKYGVRAIPANFLIDPNGKIIGHSLRGEELEKKLAEIFH